MEPQNFLFILSDQHHRNTSGCYGHPLAHTPNLDRLAARGARFANAYTNCPVCVPSRASLATGRFVHQIGHWDNAFPYAGRIPSWHHRLRQQGHRIDSIGKLHFRSTDDDQGFSQEIDPLHVVDGIGDILGCIRDDPPRRDKHRQLTVAGPGESTYLRYDASNADNAVRWLGEHGNDDKPWTVFVSFVCPHPPYIAPPELYDLYPLDQLSLPPQWSPDDWPEHPAIAHLRRFFSVHQGHDEEVVRRVTAAYLGACTYLDRQIGRVLGALEENGLSGRTRVLYTSDHGECLGARGIFGKFTLYDESAAVPLILAGAEIPEGKVIRTPVSLVDCFPTAVEAVGAELMPEDEDLPGRSLWAIANESDRERTVFSEYHAVGSQRGSYMLSNGLYKYIYYVGGSPQLFDLKNDPDECNDLSNSPEHGSIILNFERQLRDLLDPEAIDQQARDDQRARVGSFGGEQAIRQRGAFDYSPVPGEKPGFHRHE